MTRASFLFQEGNQLRLLFTRKGNLNHPPRFVYSRWIEYFPDGRQELGDLVLRPMEILGSGLVLDQSGDPIRGARVVLSATDEVYERAIQTDSPNLEASLILGLEDAFDTTDPQGKFVIHGLPLDFETQLRASHRNYRFLPEESQASGMDSVLRMEKHLDISGKLLLDAEIHKERLEFVLVDELGEEIKAYAGSKIYLNGTFTLERLPSGTFDLLLRGKSLQVDFHRWPGIHFEAGVQLPSLGEVDLRGLIHPFQITLRAPDGSLLTDAWLWRRPWLDQRNHENPMQLLRGQEVLEISVGAGSRPQMILGDPRQDLEIVLTNGIPIAVTMDPPILLDATWSLFGGVYPVGRTRMIFGRFSMMSRLPSITPNRRKPEHIT